MKTLSIKYISAYLVLSSVFAYTSAALETNTFPHNKEIGDTFDEKTEVRHKVLESKAQSNPNGKLLSMSDANINSKIYPTSRFGFYIPEQTSPYFEIDGNIFYVSINQKDTLCIAKAHGSTVYGTTVSRNEFGISGGLFPSPDNSKLAYYQKDESKVADFPLLDIDNAELKSIKYPFAGSDSELIELWVYNTATEKHIKINCEEYTKERYICCVSWHSNDELLVQVLDRSQHYMKLNLYNANNGELIKTILSEDNDAWVEPYEKTYSLSDKLFIYSTDNRDGYKNLYIVSTNGDIKRLVNTDADIEYLGHDNNYIYYTSAEISPAENHLFKVKVTGRQDFNHLKIGNPIRLTKERGWHNIKLENNCFVDRFSSFNNPGWEKVFSLDGYYIKTNYIYKDPLEDYASVEMEFGVVPSADGKYENHYRLLKPLNFDPSKKYPLLVYVYGGPHSQMVNNSWLGNIRMWEMLMAQKGYIVYVQDNRGTQRHGSAYEKAINRQCGKVEMEDQMVGINRLLEQSWVDKNRVGIHGWSYGGFMTLSLKLEYPDLFKVAVAGGPVIDWKWYEIMYGERYMDNPQTNELGYLNSSLLYKTDKLSGKVLICQGAIDDVVVWQHALSFIQACINNQKQVDFFTFPKAYHNMVGQERVYLYEKITNYFDENL